MSTIFIKQMATHLLFKKKKFYAAIKISAGYRLV